MKQISSSSAGSPSLTHAILPHAYAWLPGFLQIVVLLASISWPIYQLSLAIWGPRFKVQLTKDLFFRLTDLGECIFIRPIFLALNGEVLIQSVTAKLRKTNGGGAKAWDLEILKCGEVVRQENLVESNFYYFGSSALRFVAKGKPVQGVYMATPKGYGDGYLKAVSKFKSSLSQLKENASPTAPEATSDLNIEMWKVVDDLANALYDQIQLESGSYELEFRVHYRGVSGLSSLVPRRSNLTKLSFEVESDARDTLKNGLRSTFYLTALNFVNDSAFLIKYPEYTPVNTTEEA